MKVKCKQAHYQKTIYPPVLRQQRCFVYNIKPLGLPQMVLIEHTNLLENEFGGGEIHTNLREVEGGDTYQSEGVHRQSQTRGPMHRGGQGYQSFACRVCVNGAWEVVDPASTYHYAAEHLPCALPSHRGILKYFILSR